MTQDHAKRSDALLREALELLNDAPCFALRYDRKRTSYALAYRIGQHMKDTG